MFPFRLDSTSSTGSEFRSCLVSGHVTSLLGQAVYPNASTADVRLDADARI